MSNPTNVASDPPMPAPDPVGPLATKSTAITPPGQWRGSHYPQLRPPHLAGDWRVMGAPHPSHLGFPAGFGHYEFPTGASSGPVTEPFGPPSYPPHVIDPQLDAHNDDNASRDRKPAPPKNIKPASKVAGVRRAKAPPTTSKGKGKQKATATGSKRKAAQADSDEEPDAKRKRGGRASGVANYNDDDNDALLDAVEKHLPIGATSWDNVANTFNTWATSVDRPERTAKSLEVKFKQFLRTTKPTGDAECPPHIERAHLIEQMIDNKVETRVLNDAEHGDDVISSDEVDQLDDDEEEEDSDTTDNDHAHPRKPSAKGSHNAKVPVVKTKATKAAPVKVKVKQEPEATGPVARRADQVTLPRPRNSKTHANQFLDNISSALDPRSQAARDDERANRSMNTLQILTMSQRLQEVQASNDSLRNQIQELHQKLNDANRRADRAEFESILNTRRQEDQAARYRYSHPSDRWDLSSPSAARRRRQQRQYSPYFSPTRRHPSTPEWTTPRRRRYRDASPQATFTPDRDNYEIIPPASDLYTARIPSPARSASDLPEYVFNA